MCGIAGILSNSRFKVERTILQKMTDAIAHRGPDGEGQWTDVNQRIGLGHRRLSILDLSENGAQPMHYRNRYAIVFNGEIYNYIEIKKTLSSLSYTFNSDSDTEVLIAAYDCYKENCLDYLDGMFSFAIWDNVENTLFCARDRFGEKPFFYHIDKEDNFYFASEMKALWAVGAPKDFNNNMLFLYLAHDIVENPQIKSETFFNDIQKLEAGHYLIWKNGKMTIQQYWDIKITEENSHLSEREVIDKFRSLLYDSVALRMRSDVPLGSSLSGGLDSSTIVTIIHDILKETKQHCFSARFENFSKDEGMFIEKLTHVLNIQQHNAWNKPAALAEIFDNILFHQEEPFQTGSIVAQWSVYKLARKENVVVLLDGQGADEYLGGYHIDFAPFLREMFLKDKKSYFYHYNLLNQRHSYNHSLDIDFLAQAYLPKLKQGFSKITRKYRMVDYKSYLQPDFYNHFESQNTPFANFNGLKETFRYELMNYGLEKLLRFADRNAMAHGVEVRLPFLSHKLVEFVFSLPSEIFLKDGWSKYILRKSMEDKLIQEICWRRDKIGFESPHNQWMREPYVQDKIHEGKSKLQGRGILSKTAEIDDWKAFMMNAFL
ncbi:MAG: asparagine synthase (glutamine-hydrolyzing) [Chitinophagales bacterium]|nr:asparagine synthase (glutamine-hydrolyzing) [Chitinophagales bacterium]